MVDGLLDIVFDQNAVDTADEIPFPVLCRDGELLAFGIRPLSDLDFNYLAVRHFDNRSVEVIVCVDKIVTFVMASG